MSTLVVTFLVLTTTVCHILFMHYAAAIKILQSGVQVDFDISASNMCYDGEYPLKLILDIPIGQCVIECGIRKRCQGLNYRMNGGFILCKLLSNVGATEFTDGDCALVRRSDIEVKNLPCGNNCAEDETCDLATGICVFKECEFPSIDNGIILGNRNEIGSRLRVKCNPGYAAIGGRKTMVCDGGSWSQLPICEDIDECASSPCRHGGTCTNLLASHHCACSAGYVGSNCETDIDECASSPCQNGGTCIDAVDSYSCTCDAGYDGNNCETDIDECASSPCQHGGTCVDAVDSYSCSCDAGYEGNNCETDIDECASSPCQNGGTCTDAVDTYSCSCGAGYEGNNCETDIDECASSPCQNGGTCTDAVDTYSCSCGAGYEGNNCETDISGLILTHSPVEVFANTAVTLTCQYSAALGVDSYEWMRNGNVIGRITTGCGSDTTPDTALYEYACPATKRATLTILEVTKSNVGDVWTCQLRISSDWYITSNKYTVSVQSTTAHNDS